MGEALEQRDRWCGVEDSLDALAGARQGSAAQDRSGPVEGDGDFVAVVVRQLVVLVPLELSHGRGPFVAFVVASAVMEALARSTGARRLIVEAVISLDLVITAPVSRLLVSASHSRRRRTRAGACVLGAGFWCLY